MTSQPGALRVESRSGGLIAVCFAAMASPCELLLPAALAREATRLGALVAEEAWRIERKFNRYRDDSVIAGIHRERGHAVKPDAETALLLDFARQCHELSEGRFDITSGVLRQVWTFDGSDRLPSPEAVAALLPKVGFQKLRWHDGWLTLPAGMEIDFGGLGKEYAVDRAFALLTGTCDEPCLINFGGDLRASRPASHGSWQVGIERPDQQGSAALVLQLERGALATSGDARRYLLKDGVRYGHILDPRTGWPVPGGPRSVTVAASSCTEAGMLATMALLHGAEAEAFLKLQGVRYWLQER